MTSPSGSPTSSPVRPEAATGARVVVAVGGTDPGSPARWAAREAARTGGTVHLLQVAPHDMARAAGTAALRTATAACHDEAGDRVTVEVEQVVGDPAQAVLDACPDARLVVTGRRGSTSWHSSASVSADLAGRAHRPVCVVPPSWGGTRHHVVAVGLDPEHPDRACLTEAVRRARLEHAVLRVLVCRPGSLATDHGADTDDLRRRAEALLSECGGDACEAEVTVGSGHPASRLREVAAATDLLVLGRRPHAGEHATYLGPVARAVLPWAASPVLLTGPGPTDAPTPPPRSRPCTSPS